jgi:predicted nucleic acid-binding protein
MQRVALDTNFLAYLAGVERAPTDAEKVSHARRLFSKLAHSASLIAPVQTLGELFVVLSRAKIPADEARSIILEFNQGLETSDSSVATMNAALDLVVDHRLQYWDALILSASATARATLLLSEDMQDGFVWRGVTVVNPFAASPHRKLAALLDQP